MRPKTENIVARIQQICEREELEVTEKTLEKLVDASG